MYSYFVNQLKKKILLTYLPSYTTVTPNYKDDLLENIINTTRIKKNHMVMAIKNCEKIIGESIDTTKKPIPTRLGIRTKKTQQQQSRYKCPETVLELSKTLINYATVEKRNQHFLKEP